MNNQNQLSVIDFFCGAGGFSEGFRQMGFKIIKGYDKWKPAINTFNHNFQLESQVKDILDFENINEIESLPNTHIIIGSPPCVSFSSSNRAGKSDKTLGIRLTETYLKIVAVKKHQPNSILKAWFMENVSNSKKYLRPYYTFKHLDLTEWAIKHKMNPKKIAIDLRRNSQVVNAADYGSFQARNRIISGEIIKTGKLIIPSKTHSKNISDGTLPYRTLDEIKSVLPSPFSDKSQVKIIDPFYPIVLELDELYDHFYDTGIFTCEWKQSKFLKTNHPYMGKMSFPENEKKPSRTITATKITNSRESLIYKSELKRLGNGEYRLPTVREAATIMGFPITYQFIGSENTKWRLVGNAVCCTVSRLLARSVKESEKIQISENFKIITKPNLIGVQNLNTFSVKNFKNRPTKQKGSKFRRHPIKDGNLTVTLSNYNVDTNLKSDGKWRTSIQYGNGKGFFIQNIEDKFYKRIENLISNEHKGTEFLSIINNGFTNKIAGNNLMQLMYENHSSYDGFLEPTELVEEVASIIEKLEISNEQLINHKKNIFNFKSEVPLSQLFALYAINKISTESNSK